MIHWQFQLKLGIARGPIAALDYYEVLDLLTFK